MRSIFAFFGLVTILLLSSEGQAQFQPGGQPPGGGGFGKKKGGGGGTEGFPGGGGFGKKGGGGATFPGATPGTAPGGFAPGGGFTKGPKGGGAGFAMDPNQMFERITGGRPYFSLAQAPANLRQQLIYYIAEQGLNQEQITREQFASFYVKKEQYTGGGFVGKKDFGGERMQGREGQNPLEVMAQYAESDFRRRDQNQDSQLNPDEMPDALRADHDRWDRDHDGLISLDEYKGFFVARLQMREQQNNQNNGITILIDDDYDRRPDVIRAGKLPTNLPPWFYKLERDGQVSLPEWYKAEMELDEFKKHDRNDDGLITAQEALFYYKLTPVFTPQRGPGGSYAMNGNGNGNGYGPGGEYGASETGFGGPMGGKKKGPKGGGEDFRGGGAAGAWGGAGEDRAIMIDGLKKKFGGEGGGKKKGGGKGGG